MCESDEEPGIPGWAAGGGTRIFVKVLAALTLLLCQPVLDLATTAVFCVPRSRTSLDGPFPLQFGAHHGLAQAASLVIYLAVGLALSFLRQSSWLVLGTLMATVSLDPTGEHPGLPATSFGSASPTMWTPAGHPQYRAWGPAGPGRGLPDSRLCCLFAPGGWGPKAEGWGRATPGGHDFEHDSHCSQRGHLDWSACLRQRSPSPPDKNVVSYTPWPTVQANTGHYRFLYPENGQSVVLAFIDQATRRKPLRRFLGATPLPQIKGLSHPLAAWPRDWPTGKTANIDLDEFGYHSDGPLAVLGHETTHVYIDQASDSRLNDQVQHHPVFP